MVHRPVPDVSISSVAAVSRCPVRFYLEKKEKKPESWRYTLTKQLSYHLSDDLDEETIWEEACLIHDEPDPGLKPFLSEMVRLCRNNRKWRPARETDVSVQSGSFGIHGIVDRMFEEEPYFAIVRSGPAPSRGVFATDRVRVTGYTICLKEMFGNHIHGGSIEYLPSGVSRDVIVEPRDKRKFLHALHETRRIMNGGLPRKPLRPLCTHCPYHDRCEPSTGKRLSELF
jgi:CRISPR/Cas system-associated exonuclease Cas4 (RecB family)